MSSEQPLTTANPADLADAALGNPLAAMLPAQSAGQLPGQLPSQLPGPFPTGAANADPLAALRDIHTVGAPSWWPPAPGWWLLAAAVVLALLWMLARLRRRRRRLAPWQAARNELSQLLARYRHDGDSGQFVRELSALLRRAALTDAPRQQVAALSGQAWLEYLDQRGATDGFRQGAGRILADGPYAAVAELEPADVEALYHLARLWLKQAAA